MAGMDSVRDKALIDKGLRAVATGIALNFGFALVKTVAGFVGNSYALVADGIESAADVVASVMVWCGIRIGVIPADEEHPYGHGKAESLAAILVGISVVGAAVFIAWQSVREILNPGVAPSWFTLPVLAGVVAMKTWLARRVHDAGAAIGSTALQGDAMHHGSDALTSGAAFVGIAAALIGGPGWEGADDWAALLACAVIARNGFGIFRAAIDEIMDRAVTGEVQDAIRRCATDVKGVVAIEKLRVRKSGIHLLLDIHVVVDGDAPVRQGHAIGHDVQSALKESNRRIGDVVVHIEPDDGMR